MHDEVPVTQMQTGAAPGRRPGLRAFLMVLLGAAMICATAHAGPAGANKAAGAKAQAGAPASSDFVGSDVCAACHQAQVDKFANNPHQKMVLMHGGAAGMTCENCHGPGKAHVEGGGDKTKIFQFSKASAKDADAKCLSCHAGAHPDFERSPHAKAGVSCISCHSIHDAKTKEQLLKASQPTLCFQCHGDTKPAFGMPFHHPVEEGVVQCSDCHDVHGTFGPNNLRSAVDQSKICTKCHTDVRGPFVYEHAPVKAEGCLGCHSPHGSQNARMLNMPSINTLCNQCHSRVANATVHGMGAGSDELVPCTSCHTYIHGSNINAAFLR
ncbi:MAG TPA: DmsE family decaheme c-type cytochrome [Terracidiphilus sp.]|nr:DmsE family decaheme c-type cytochrome [Terracidiphilus sp.]